MKMTLVYNFIVEICLFEPKQKQLNNETVYPISIWFEQREQIIMGKCDLKLFF